MKNNTLYLPTLSAERRASFNAIFASLNDRRFLVYDIVRAIIEEAISDHAFGFGSVVDISFDEKAITIRNFGRGLPNSSVVDCMLGVGKITRSFSDQFYFDFPHITAISSVLYVASFRENKCSYAHFKGGELEDFGDKETNEINGLLIKVEPDNSIFGDYSFDTETLRSIVTNYSFLYPKMVFHLNGEMIQSEKGIIDLVNRDVGEDALYTPIELIGRDALSVVICHRKNTGDSIYSFANNRYTSGGGTHVESAREAIRLFLKRNFKASSVIVIPILYVLLPFVFPQVDLPMQPKQNLYPPICGRNITGIRNKQSPDPLLLCI